MKKNQKTKLNKLVREFIILRDKCCLRCGKTQNLHASHIYPRGKYPKMAYDVNNVKALCLGCHLYWWHKHPIEAKDWAEKTLGKVRLRQLKKQANTINKNKLIFEEIRDELQKKLEDLNNVN
jgi:5-methylcytosine-specific restriction endonuclease McrA|tara:strand:- start:74 stop:439 length:366 start_codon:yes stop_codon:yes gene_type:complete